MIIIARTGMLDLTHFILESLPSVVKTNKIVRRTRKPAITVASAWSMSLGSRPTGLFIFQAAC
jgi:hypothetical protein